MQKTKTVHKTTVGALLLVIAVLTVFISSFGHVRRADAIDLGPVEAAVECKHTFYAVDKNSGKKISLTNVVATLYFSKSSSGSSTQYTCTGGYVGDAFTGKNYSSYAKLYNAVASSAAFGLASNYVCYGSENFTPSGYSFYDGEATNNALPDRTISLSFSQETLTFTVTFDTVGGDELTPLEVEGNTVPELPTPTRAGYVFNGWCVPGKFGALVAYDVTTPITADITLTASWKKLYVLSFDTAGGNAIESIEVVTGTAISLLTLPTPTRAGYDFMGWTYNGQSIADTQKVTSDMQLVAAWELHRPTVTFIVEGETYAVVTVEQGTVFV